MAEKHETPYEDIAVFAPSAASEELLRQVDDAVHEINDHRPLTREVLQKLETDILYDRVHSSAVTEGNRLSRRETIVVLTSGVIEAGSRKDIVEVRNLAAAITSLEEALREGAPLSENLVRDLHKLLLQDLDDANAGRYRVQNVAITGAKVVPPLGLDVPRLMHEVVSSPEIHNTALHVLQRATWMHWVICRVHPFLDGNGRLARLLQDYILLKSTYVPAPLRSEDREGEYYSALEAADCGKGRGLLELIAKNTLRMADRYLAVIREERAKQSWVANITKVATEKVQQTAHRKFLAVQRSSNLLKGEFFKHAGELEGAIPGLSLRFTDYGGIDFEKFQDLTHKGAAKRTWSFGLEFRIGNTALRYIFWHGVHRSRPEDTVGHLPSEIVILVSAEEDDNYYRLLDDIEEDRVSIREAVPSSGLFWRRRFNPISGHSEWDKDVSGGEIARTFIQEVLGKLGLV